MTVTHFTPTKKERLESIGWVDALTALKLSFSQEIKNWRNEASTLTSEEEIKQICARFNEKVIIDVGAGFSELLNTIHKYSHPKELIAVDPMYNDIWTGTEYTIQSIQSFIDFILFAQKQSKSKRNNPWMTEMLNNLERQRNEVAAYSNQSALIQRVSIIPKDTKADYVFLMSTLHSSLLDPWVLLEEVKDILQPNGKVVIIDFMDNKENSVFDVLNVAWIPIIDTYNQYFCAHLGESDVVKLSWKQQDM